MEALAGKEKLIHLRTYFGSKDMVSYLESTVSTQILMVLRGVSGRTLPAHVRFNSSMKSKPVAVSLESMIAIIMPSPPKATRISLRLADHLKDPTVESLASQSLEVNF